MPIISQKLYNLLKSKIEKLNVEGKIGKIGNRPESDEKILENVPNMTGVSDCPALQEIHVFFEPVGTDGNEIPSDLLKRYSDIVDIYNETARNHIEYFKEMKAPILCLKFKDVGYVTVMQMSLYVLSNCKDDVVEMCHQLADLFSIGGLNVIREKIEASIYGINGIPKTEHEIEKCGKYFEFHIRVKNKRTNDYPIDNDELLVLENLSELLSKKSEEFFTYVPLSYNKAKYSNYLNARYSHVGYPTAVSRIRMITDDIHETGKFKVDKIISEFVWYDTFRQLDKGWIDF